MNIVNQIVFTASLIIFTTLTANAVELDLSDPSKYQLNSVVTIPIKSLKAVEANGEIYFMSENGRFVLRGELFDVWHRSNLDTSRQINDAVTRIRFDRMNANIDDYNTLTIGTGDKEVVAFVDPLCAICHKLMIDSKQLTKEYTFKFVIVPALGAESDQLARRLFCASEGQDTLTSYLNNDLNSLLQNENCDTAQYDSTLMIAHLLDIQGVPFVVAPDGRYSQGRPRNLSDWLENK